MYKITCFLIFLRLYKTDPSVKIIEAKFLVLMLFFFFFFLKVFVGCQKVCTS